MMRRRSVPGSSERRELAPRRSADEDAEEDALGESLSLLHPGTSAAAASASTASSPVKGSASTESSPVKGSSSLLSPTTTLSTAVVMVPPLNFAMVSPGVYRSGYPNRKNFPFLTKLGIRSIVYLAKESYTSDNTAFFESSGIRVFHYRLNGNKEPFGVMGEEDVAQVIGDLLDRRNHPILVHCNKGKHRVGCVVGCLRKLQRWSLTAIFDEYQRFAGKATRMADTQFIELFDAEACVRYDSANQPQWIATAQGRDVRHEE